MKVKIAKVSDLVHKVLGKFGFSSRDCEYATKVIIEAELVGKPSHGLIRLISMSKMIADGRVTVTKEPSEIVKETLTSLLVDGKKKPGFMVVPFALDKAITKIKTDKTTIACGGVTNTSPAAGMIGYYARQATQNNLIYIGFHNSMSYLVPYGSKKPLWGTNPVTIGVPGASEPVIWDCGSSKMSVGDILIAKRKGQQLNPGIAVNKNGDETTDPVEALMGGILPFANHKGSGMAMMVELLAGALMSSSITPDHQWNWGSFFLLINPEIFTPLDRFKQSVQASIELLKNSPQADGVQEIKYPGEKSNKSRQVALDSGELDIDHQTYTEVSGLLTN